MRAIIMTLWLQDVLLVRNFSHNGPSDVANGNGEHALPRSGRCSGIAPAVLESILGARRRGLDGVVKFGVGISVEGGVDDILSGDG